MHISYVFYPAPIFSCGSVIRRASLSMRTKLTLSTRRSSEFFLIHYFYYAYILRISITVLYCILSLNPSFSVWSESRLRSQALELQIRERDSAVREANEAATRAQNERGEHADRVEALERQLADSQRLIADANDRCAPESVDCALRNVRESCRVHPECDLRIVAWLLALARRVVFIEKEMEVLKRDKRDLEDLIADTQKQKSAPPLSLSSACFIRLRFFHYVHCTVLFGGIRHTRIIYCTLQQGVRDPRHRCRGTGGEQR